MSPRDCSQPNLCPASSPSRLVASARRRKGKTRTAVVVAWLYRWRQVQVEIGGRTGDEELILSFHLHRIFGTRKRGSVSTASENCALNKIDTLFDVLRAKCSVLQQSDCGTQPFFFKTGIAEKKKKCRNGGSRRGMKISRQHSSIIQGRKHNKSLLSLSL